MLVNMPDMDDIPEAVKAIVAAMVKAAHPNSCFDSDVFFADQNP